MIRRLQCVIAALTLMLAGPGTAHAQAKPSTATDRDDYSPGSTVSISGARFRPNEAIQLQILQISPRDNKGPEHRPWRVVADADGNFRATWPVTAHEAGAKLRLTAKGLESHLRAQTIFTDASVVPASGGGAIPADTYAGSYTALTGPVITETIVGDISVGTIVLTAPPGFVFDTNAPLPIITLSGDSNNKNINTMTNGEIIPLVVTTNSLSFTINTKSKGQTKNTLTYSNVRVRPTAAAPLASGDITNTGTSIFPNNNVNFGTLTEVAGASTQLGVSGFPNPQTSGVAASVTVTAEDQFGNPATGYTGTVHFTSSDAQAILPADYTFVAADNGAHTFSGVSLQTIGTQSITASNMVPASFTGTQSGISINPAPADHLVFSVQPGSATYGSLLSPQPVLVSKDASGNNSSVGLGVSKIVTVTLTSGSGQLLGTASMDIGTGAGNGTATFTNLTVNAVGTGLQLTASAAGLSNAPSSTFAITAATVTANVIVNNKAYDGTTGATIATRSLSGVIGGDNVTLTGGTATFATKTAGNGKTVTVTGLSLSGTSAANYVLASTSATTTANITAATLTVSGVSANNKVYDGTASATLNTAGAALVGILGTDVVTLNTGSAAGVFANKNVGTGKTVTVIGLTLGGADAANYSLTQPTTTANITTTGLTVSGIVANNKVYNGTTVATLSTGGAALVGILGSDVVTLNMGSATGTFANKTVGTGKTVTVSGLTLGGADSANYSLTQPTTTANITAAGLTVSGVLANNKVYDGTTIATLNTTGATLVGVFGTDVVTLSTGGATGAFASKNVGTAKAVTVSGLSLGGADAANYALTQPSTTANITAAALTVTGLSAGNKIYDSTTSATLSGAPALAGVLGSDGVSLNGTATGTFSDKTVGTAKTVSVTGLSLGGADAGNYSLSQPSLTANITAASLSVSGVTADNKAYDGTTAAVIHTGSAVLVGKLGSDVVTLSIAGAVGTFADADVGTTKTVSVSGLSISGADAGNYGLVQPTTTADITQAGLTVTGISASDKVYDGTTDASLDTNHAALVGLQSGDQVTLILTNATGAFDSKAAGTGKAVTVSGLEIVGPDGSKYTLTQPTTNANITAATLTVTGMAANDKIYDSTTAASLAGTAALAGVLGSDDVSLSGTATGTFSDKNVGTAKTVNVSGLSLSGADAGNYALNATSLVADISSAGLSVSGLSASNKVYDGTSVAGLSGTAALVGALGSDSVTLSGVAAGTYNDKAVGAGKTVSVSGLSLSGPDAGNYTLSEPSLSADITPAGLSVGGLSANNKIYDATTAAGLSGTAVLVGVLGSDAVTLNGAAVGSFSDKTVGTAKTVNVSGLSLSGADAGNYSLSQPSLLADITPAGLTVNGLSANNRVYDSTTAASLSGSATLVGVIGSDAVSLSGTAIGTFSDKAVGTAKTVSVTGLSPSGPDAGNYSLSEPSLAANISAAALNVTGVTADNKAYDGTTAAVIHTGSAALVGKLGSDVVTLNTAGAVGTFADADVGTGKTVSVSGLSIGGADAGNYGLVQPTATADITQAGLTVSGISASDKIYDGTTEATLQTNNAVLVGVESGDQVLLILTNATGAFDSKSVGTSKMVTVSGLEIVGPDAGKYTLTQPTTNASITPATLTVTGLTANNKVYDGTTTASLTGTPALVGVLGSDDVALSGTATGTFSDKTVGTAKTVSVSGLSLTGADAGNYTLTEPSLVADISPATIVVSGLSANDKVYDGTTAAALSGTGTLTGVLGSDDVALNGTAVGTFTDKTAGTGKTVNVSGIDLSGADEGNYTYADPILSANITPAVLTVTGLSANNKVYDATTAAGLSGTPVLAGVLGSDNVAVSGTAVGTFNDKIVGAAKPVNVSGLSLSGGDAGNYTLSQPSLGANITPAVLSVTGITADNKTFDGTTAAAIHTGASVLVGKLGSDDVILNTAAATGAFLDAAVGTAKTVDVSGLSLSGADAVDYGLVQPTTTADITAGALTVAGISASDKVYDGTTLASLQTNGAALVGVQGGDQVLLILTNASGVFNSKAVGSSKTVTVSGLQVVGPDAGKYTLTQPTTHANITPAGLTMSGLSANNKVYDTTTAAGLSGVATLIGVVGNDAVTLNGTAVGAFDSKTAGAVKSVTVSGLSLSGADAGNYTLNQPILSASISSAALTVSGLSASSKVYDGTAAAGVNGSPALVGVLGSDVVSLGGAALSTFNNKAVGAGKPVIVSGLSLSGPDAGNYTLSQPNLQGNITPAGLTVSGLSANNKVYDGTTTATVSGTPVLAGVLGTDAVSLSGSAVGSFVSKAVGIGKVVNVSGLGLAGADGGNYTISIPTLQANITTASLTVTATANDKVYDGTTAASAHLSDNRAAGDALSTSFATAAFVDKNVGNGKTVNVTGISVTGADAGNYVANTSATAIAAINPATLIGTAGNQSRLYGSANPGFTVTYTGFVSGENSSLLTGSLSFSTTANVNSSAGNYAVTPSGQSAPNYTIQYVAGTLTVNPAPLSVAANNATRPYGTANPQFTATFTGFVNGENTNVLGGALTFTTTAQANSAPADYPIVPGGVSSANYSITFVNGTLTITAANDYLAITVGSTNVTRGKSAAVPIYLASSEGVTNLSFNIAWPSGHLSNAALVATGPAMATCSLQDQGTNLVFSMQTIGGQALQGTQQLAQLSFLAISNQNPALLPLPIQHTLASKPNGSSYTNYVAPTPTIAVVGGEPFLFATLAPDSSRSLTLYGLLGVGYQLQYATNFGAPITWTPVWNYVQTNSPMVIGVDSAHPVIFYRLFKP